MKITDIDHVELSVSHCFLGCLLNNPALMAKYKTLPSGIFTREEDKEYFEVMRELFNQYQTFSIDTMRKTLDITFQDYRDAEITMMHFNNPSSALHKSYIDLLYKEAMSFYLLKMADETKTDVFSNDPDAVMKTIEDKIKKLRSWKQQEGLLTLSQAHSNMYERLCEMKDNEHSPKILTGYECLDRNYGQLLPNQLHIIAARPRMGKSMFALNVAVNIAKQGFKVLYFSLEMGELQTMTRYMQVVHGIPQKQFTDLSNDFLGKFGDLTPPNDNLFFCYKAGVTLDDVESQIIKQKEIVGNVDVVVVDHMHLMRAQADNPTQESMMISRGLKIISGTQNVSIIALAQMNREVEKRTTKEPQLSDIAQSGAIEQDAETVLFLHRDEDPDCNPDELKLICRKNRNGVGYFTALCDIDFNTYRIYEKH